MNIHRHLDLLLRTDRTIKLRSLIYEIVGPGIRVLDAGCGSGILSCFAGMAGAKCVDAVDQAIAPYFSDLMTRNGVSDLVRSYQMPLEEFVEERGEKYDVILALLYFTDPRRDESQSRLILNLKKKLLANGGMLLPNKVTYQAQLVEFPEQNLRSRFEVVSKTVEKLGSDYELDLVPLCRAALEQADSRWYPVRNEKGMISGHGLKTLSTPDSEFKVDYMTEQVEYPERVDFQIENAGNADCILWTQKLQFGENILFENQSISWIQTPTTVREGQVISTILDSCWRKQNFISQFTRN